MNTFFKIAIVLSTFALLSSGEISVMSLMGLRTSSAMSTFAGSGYLSHLISVISIPLVILLYAFALAEMFLLSIILNSLHPHHTTEP